MSKQKALPGLVWSRWSWNDNSSVQNKELSVGNGVENKPQMPAFSPNVCLTKQNQKRIQSNMQMSQEMMV